jgi:hypothetical protein
VSHKLFTILLLFTCFLGVNATLWGQSADAAHGIQGYLDPKTGAFHPLPHPADPDAEPPVLTTYAGKLVFNFTITVNATIAAAAKITCQASASVLDVSTTGSFNDIAESATVVAVRSGSTATCTVAIPYSWNLASGPTDTIAMSYQIQGPAEVAAATAALPARVSIRENLATIKVPVTGTTTTETVTARF